MEYAFGFSYKHLQSPEFDSFHKAYDAMASAAHVANQFPWIINVSQS